MNLPAAPKRLMLWHWSANLGRKYLIGIGSRWKHPVHVLLPQSLHLADQYPTLSYDRFRQLMDPRKFLIMSTVDWQRHCHASVPCRRLPRYPKQLTPLLVTQWEQMFLLTKGDLQAINNYLSWKFIFTHAGSKY